MNVSSSMNVKVKHNTIIITTMKLLHHYPKSGLGITNNRKVTWPFIMTQQSSQFWGHE